MIDMAQEIRIHLPRIFGESYDPSNGLGPLPGASMLSASCTLNLLHQLRSFP